MNIPIYQVDAFSSDVFSGNPAAVCPLPHWLDERTMQLIARENNLSETAFFVIEGDHYRIRWFTPCRRSGSLRPCHPGLGLYNLYRAFPGVFKGLVRITKWSTLGRTQR